MINPIIRKQTIQSALLRNFHLDIYDNYFEISVIDAVFHEESEYITCTVSKEFKKVFIEKTLKSTDFLEKMSYARPSRKKSNYFINCLSEKI